MRPKAIGLLISLALSVNSGAMRSQESLSREDGLRVMRGVMTLEANGASGTHNEWADLVQVVKASETDAASWKPLDGSRTNTKLVDAIVDSSTATVFDYTLRLTRSDDKKHFQLSLVPTEATSGRPSWFGDDRFVIYMGLPIR